MKTWTAVAVMALTVAPGCNKRGRTGDKQFNVNKVVIGGGNLHPQAGLFALTPKDAAKVDHLFGSDSKAAFDYAGKVAKKKWVGDRTFCEDAVRMNIGYLGGNLSASDRARWRAATFDSVKAKHMKAIDTVYQQMMNDRAPKACERTLRAYVEALRYVSSDANRHLVLRNFGY